MNLLDRKWLGRFFFTNSFFFYWGHAVSETLTVFNADEFIEGTSGSSIMKRILLVDDHEMARQALKLFLEHQGYACEEAEHGAAALGWLAQGQPVDLIVSDNHMPVMTGLEFLLQVKANPHFSTIPVILYSGNITDTMRRQAQQGGAFAVLSKPYNFSDFVAVVTRALETP
jgi:two-component system chemotaxis response regulator CheY